MAGRTPQLTKGVRSDRYEQRRAERGTEGRNAPAWSDSSARAAYRHFEAERVYSGLSKVHQMGVLLSSDAEVTYFMSRMRASEADREQVKAILDHHVGASDARAG